MESKAFNQDCMEGMKNTPSKYYDLAVVDPPYGGATKQNNSTNLRGGGTNWQDNIRSRFGGLFDRYHITKEDINVAERVQGYL